VAVLVFMMTRKDGLLHLRGESVTVDTEHIGLTEQETQLPIAVVSDGCVGMLGDLPGMTADREQTS
jgi:hypothetical protein